MPNASHVVYYIYYSSSDIISNFIPEKLDNNLKAFPTIHIWLAVYSLE